MIYLPIAVCLSGLVIYLICRDDKPRLLELARIAYAMGLLVLLLEGIKWLR